MSPTKLLQINPTLFSVNSNGSNKSLKKKTTKPELKDNQINPNRKALLAKIKNFQKKERENKHKIENNFQNKINLTEKQNVINEDIEEFEGEFNKSLNFLQELSNRHTLKKKERKNKTLKKTKDIGNNINLELPQELKESEITIQSINKEQSNKTTKDDSHNNTPVTTSPPLIINTPIINDQIIQKPLIQKPSQVISQSISLSNTIPTPPLSVVLPTTLPPPPQPSVLPQVSLSPIVLSNPPPYSNLKGSLKPTYREWLQKTQKNYKKNDNISFSDKNQISEIPIQQPISNLSTALNETINKVQNNTKSRNKSNKSNIVLTKKPIEKINKKTRTIKYTLGKKGNKIGVLIKNSNTRKKIKDDFLKLKKKNISEIKEVLRNKNLIKAGTLAPNDVLREIYEQSILTGDIVNKNKDALIHNYFSNK